MSNQNLNPLSRLLDIDFPEIKRANWNNSFDTAFTADVGYIKPVFVDRVMAGSRCQLDFDSASFANSTIAPLYGRFKVKYLAFWAPDRLYMSDWLTGEKMLDDDYPYPFIKIFPSNGYSQPNVDSNFAICTAQGNQYVPPTSLTEYLGIYPAFTTTGYWLRPNISDSGLPSKNAFPFLAFWDAYRTFFINPQETTFPVRTQSAEPTLTRISTFTNPQNTYPTVESLDEFFRKIKRASTESERDVVSMFRSSLGFNPITCPRRVFQLDTSVTYSSVSDAFSKCQSNSYFSINYHYGLPIGTYLSDPYTSFVSNENVELERIKSKVNFTGTVDGTTSSGSFTMEQWYLASRIQSKIRKNLYKFDDFSQWIDTNFGVKPSTTLTKPLFLGAFMSDIIFNDAISTVQQPDTDGVNNLENNSNLGSRAGYGVGYKGDKRNFFDFTAKEPGTVMIVQQIIPEVFYFEGSDKMYEKLNFNEEFNPIFDALGFQDLEKADMNMVPYLSYDPTATRINRISSPSSSASNPGITVFSSYNTAVAQQPYGFEHMAKPNRLMGQMTQNNYYQSWSLARSFNYVRGQNPDELSAMPTPASLDMYSSYIIPEMYNNIFANTNNVDNFQFYLSFQYTKYQPVSKQFLSFT